MLLQCYGSSSYFKPKQKTCSLYLLYIQYMYTVYSTWLNNKHKLCRAYTLPPHHSWPHRSNPHSRPCHHTSTPGSHTLRWHTGRCRHHTLSQTQMAWLTEKHTGTFRRFHKSVFVSLHDRKKMNMFVTLKFYNRKWLCLMDMYE